MKSKLKHGVLITFEGSEGCGKSTQIKRIAARLRKLKYPVLLIREPGGTAVGERIRHLLKFSKSNGGMLPETELMLFSASRAQLVREKILPALQKGAIVLCDRFVDSTTVYQGMARKLDLAFIKKLNSFVTNNSNPNLTFVLDLDPLIGLKRARKKTKKVDRMEAQKRSFYKAVRLGFIKLARQQPSRIKLLDASAPLKVVEAKIWHHVSHFLS